MNIKPIKTEADYQDALEKLEEVFDAPGGTRENELAEILVTLIGKYEDENYSIDAPDPIEAIKIRMTEMDLKQRDLVEMVGAKSRGMISNILNKRRPLTLPVIRALSTKLGISSDVLIREYSMKA